VKFISAGRRSRWSRYSPHLIVRHVCVRVLEPGTWNKTQNLTSIASGKAEGTEILRYTVVWPTCSCYYGKVAWNYRKLLTVSANIRHLTEIYEHNPSSRQNLLIDKETLETEKCQQRRQWHFNMGYDWSIIVCTLLAFSGTYDHYLESECLSPELYKLSRSLVWACVI
jgi:hypothetical protein